MSEFLTPDSDKLKQLQSVVQALAKGTDPQSVKRQFNAIIKGATAAEVAAMEQSLIEQGVPVTEVQRLCEVHADVFRAGLEQGKPGKLMPGHPVHTFIKENKVAKKLVRQLVKNSWIGSLDAIQNSIKALQPIIIHYERKENQIFPYLEKTGFTGPSKVMWGKHDEIRALFKALEASLSTDKPIAASVRHLARDLARHIRMMVFMEEKILFPNALKRLTNRDWAEIRQGEPAIGYAWVEPGAEWDAVLAKYFAQERPSQPAATSGSVNRYDAMSSSGIGNADISHQQVTLEAQSLIPLSVGSLPLGVLDSILRLMPFDISFVDANDKVMFYSDSPHRVFPRSPAIIGRAVQNCHPPKSVATVEKILEAFKNKEKDKAEFWLELGGKFIYIAYKPVYDTQGQYLGTLEMSMDATELRSLTGQRKLLDW